MAINLVAEMLEKHNDIEVIEHLARIMNGVIKNYNIALEKGNSEILWANVGDLTLVAETLRNMKKRNDDRVANSQKS